MVTSSHAHTTNYYVNILRSKAQSSIPCKMEIVSHFTVGTEGLIDDRLYEGKKRATATETTASLTQLQVTTLKLTGHISMDHCWGFLSLSLFFFSFSVL